MFGKRFCYPDTFSISVSCMNVSWRWLWPLFTPGLRCAFSSWSWTRDNLTPCQGPLIGHSAPLQTSDWPPLQGFKNLRSCSLKRIKEARLLTSWRQWQTRSWWRVQLLVVRWDADPVSRSSLLTHSTMQSMACKAPASPQICINKSLLLNRWRCNNYFQTKIRYNYLNKRSCFFKF